MTIEYRLEPRLIGLQRTSHHSDLIETIAVHLSQGQDFTTDRRQFLLNPDHVCHGKFDQFRCCDSVPFPIPILMTVCQRKKMALEELAGKAKGLTVLQWEIQRGRHNARDRVKE